MIATRLLILLLAVCSCLVTASEDLSVRLDLALAKSGKNAGELRKALKQVDRDQLAGMEFLIAYMPERDLLKLNADFLEEHVTYAYKAWREAPWHDTVPEDVFLNNILPYSSINEKRDTWMKDFQERFKPFTAGITTPGKAAAKLNNTLFPAVNVKYSTRRRKADQSPYETIESGLASCTGLSILLIDACRALGIPARFVGTPLWSDRSGNHSWIEVWDNGWHFTGAAEPTGDQLDKAWFTGRASKASRDDRLHAIYAVSYKQTPQLFPMVWNPKIDYVYAVNVTDRYLNLDKKLPSGYVNVMFKVLDSQSGNRCAARVKVSDTEGLVVFEGKSKDERFDANDHVIAALREGKTYTLEVDTESSSSSQTIVTDQEGQLIRVELE